MTDQSPEMHAEESRSGAATALAPGGDDPERPVPPPAEPFAREDLERFDREDTTAGSHIGKMLAFFFLYTVIVMGLVAWLTFSGILG